VRCGEGNTNSPELSLKIFYSWPTIATATLDLTFFSQWSFSGLQVFFTAELFSILYLGASKQECSIPWCDNRQRAPHSNHVQDKIYTAFILLFLLLKC